MYTVYAPSFGYGLSSGKSFRYEYEAIRLVQRLRRSGHMAWVEINLGGR